jgi:ankyrin repeat protein
MMLQNNATNSEGETPLHNAVRNTTPGGLAIIRLLRERGADPTIPNEKGSTALRFIERYGKPDEREVFADLL